MNRTEAEPRASDVSICEDKLNVQLTDDRTITVPLSWFPRLSSATASQRHNFRLIGRGVGIHWPEIDEDLSVAGLLVGWHPRSSSAVARNEEKNSAKLGRPSSSAHEPDLRRRYAVTFERLPHELSYFGHAGLRSGSLRMLAGAKSWSGVDAMIRSADQLTFLEVKSFAWGKTLKELAGSAYKASGQLTKEAAGIRLVQRTTAEKGQVLRAFNPATEGSMAVAA